MATYTSFINVFLWIGTGLYICQSGMYLSFGLRGQSLMMFAYAVANLGIIWSVHETIR